MPGSSGSSGVAVRQSSRGATPPLALLFLLTAVLLVPLLALVPSHSVGATLPPLGAAPHGLAPASGVSYPTPIRHVFVIYLENEELSSVNSSGHYENALAHNFTAASNYFAPCHPSAPEYLAGTSGATWQCGSDSVKAGAYSTSNIGELAQQAGLPWDAYMESMPAPCDASDSYPYAARHDPFVYYSDLSGSVCKAHVLNFSAWNSTVASGTLPAFAFFSPNLLDDGHDTSVAYADNWLKGWLPKYLNAPWFNSSVWFITYDEGSSNSGYGSLSGGHLFFTAVSPYSSGGHLYTNDSTHYNLLSTAEWLLGLGGTGNNDSSAKYPAMKGLFHFSSGTGTSTFTVGGRVTALSTGLALPGVKVSVGGGSSTSTNSSGYYTLSLPNGTYSLTASISGFVSQTTSIKVSGKSITQGFTLSAQTQSTRTYAISGTVESWYNSTLLPGAIVKISAGGSVTVGSNGTYRFVEPNGTYTVTALHGGSAATSVTVSVSGANVVSNFLLPRYYWKVSGTVTNAGNGATISGANVSVVSGPSSYAQYSLTGPSGGYILWLANGTYGLRVVSGGASANIALTVSGGAVVRNVALSTSGPAPSTYRISGTVSYWYNYSLASGASVSLGGASSMVTAGNGTYWFDEPNGTYTLTAWHGGCQVTSTTVTVSGSSRAYNFLLPRFYWKVSGTVTNSTTGAKIQGANVTIVSGPSSYSQYSLTDSSGAYTLWLANGTYGLRATVQGSVVWTGTVQVAGGAVVHNIAFQPLSGARPVAGPSGTYGVGLAFVTVLTIAPSGPNRPNSTT